MADSVITSLLLNLSQLVLDEINFHSDLKEKIKSLSKELEFIDAFLQSSHGRRNHPVVKIVESQIRDVAHQAEDLVETYVASARLYKSRKNLEKLIEFPGQEILLRGVDAEIDKVKRRIEDMYMNKDRYGIGEGEFQSEESNEAAESLRKIRRDVEEENVVGLQQYSTLVINKLKEGGSRLHVVSIIGMGGLGKTTLARTIYKSSDVKDLFPSRGWGYVSNDYRVKELLHSLLQRFMKPFDQAKYQDLSEEELKKSLRKCLKQKIYLVVLDDIWNTQVWDEIQGVFPNVNNGSRILITSRNKEVASYAGTRQSIYSLPFLTSEQDSWELFSKKVFKGEDCPPNLKDLGMSMVKSCGGLPLAIVALAELVAKKKVSQREWLRIKDHLDWHFCQDGNIKVMNILKLSYDHLPRRLKSCFLYFGIYPKDYEISVKQLIKLWIAEGFIEPPRIGNAPELEDIGEYYLDELVDRNLVQVTGKRSDGGVKTCRIHSLLHDLCVMEGKANKSMEVCTELEIDKCCDQRRMSLHCKTPLSFSPINNIKSHARSLFVFGKDLQLKGESKCCEWMKSFKLARVLHFKGAFLDFPPTTLDKMVLLRYLKIETTYELAINVLVSIWCLWNLETLHLSYIVSEETLTIEILNRAERLLKSRIKKESNCKTRRNLQTLSDVPLENETAIMLTNCCFPNLKKLGLYRNPSGDHSRSALSSLQLDKLSKLGILKIEGVDDSPFDKLEFSPKLFPINLTKFTFTWFRDLDYKTLGQLPNLQILKLEHGVILDNLDCRSGDFPALRVLKMVDVFVEGGWTLEQGAMPSLTRLIIQGSMLLTVPQQLLPWTTFI